MSAAAHRAEADREHQAARDDLAAARSELPVRAWGPFIQTQDWIEPHQELGSPHLEAARAHSRHAREHKEAAEALERFEDTECRALAPESRPSCPLLHDVLEIVDVPGGVRVSVADTVSVPDVVAHIRCHLAYARTRAFEGVEDCPLYVRGVRVAAVGAHAIEITAAERETVNRIRALCREQALPAPRPGGG